MVDTTTYHIAAFYLVKNSRNDDISQFQSINIAYNQFGLAIHTHRLLRTSLNKLSRSSTFLYHLHNKWSEHGHICQLFVQPRLFQTQYGINIRLTEAPPPT